MSQGEENNNKKNDSCEKRKGNGKWKIIIEGEKALKFHLLTREQPWSKSIGKAFR